MGIEFIAGHGAPPFLVRSAPMKLERSCPQEIQGQDQRDQAEDRQNTVAYAVVLHQRLHAAGVMFTR